MVNGINNIGKTPSIFAEMSNFAVNQVPNAVSEQKADTVELSNKKTMSKEKKVIIGTSIAVGVALAILAFIKRKEICALIKKIFDNGGGDPPPSGGAAPSSPPPSSPSFGTQLKNGSSQPPQDTDGTVANVVSTVKDKLQVPKLKLAFDFDKLMEDLSKIKDVVDEKWVTENSDSALNLINAASKGEPFSKKQFNIISPTVESKVRWINTLISNKEKFIEEATIQYKNALA